MDWGPNPDNGIHALAGCSHHVASSHPPSGPRWSLSYPMDSREKKNSEKTPPGAYTKAHSWQPVGSAVTGHARLAALAQA